MKIVIKIKKPRNPFVPLALKRKAGAHQKSNRKIEQKNNLMRDVKRYLREEYED